MSFIPAPYRYHPRRRAKLTAADIAVIALVLAFAAVCLFSTQAATLTNQPTQGVTTP
jgi:hypothetical protein